MARRTLRRANKSVNGSGNIDGVNAYIDAGSDSRDDDNTERKSGTISDAHQRADGDVESDAGQPDKSDIHRVIEVDPGELSNFIANGGTTGDTGDSDSGEPRKQRRKRGPNKSKASSANIAPVLDLIHTWAAILLRTPAIRITEEESKQLADAYGEFSKYHSVPLLSPKRMSEINLLGALGLVYGTRVMAAIKNRKERGPKVVQMPNQQRTQ